MAENTTKFSTHTDANAIGSEITDNWVNVKTRPTEAIEHQLSHAIDTINSLTDQVSKMTAAITTLSAHIDQIETKLLRLEIERECRR